jgi:hypothetical protein
MGRGKGGRLHPAGLSRPVPRTYSRACAPASSKRQVQRHRGFPRNLFARIQNGELRLHRADALLITPAVRKLRSVVGASLPQVRIEDMLRQVDRWTGLTRALTPLGGYEPRRGEDS